MKKYGRIDQNHQQIVSGLRQAGCRVLSLAALGHGCPDLLVLSGGRLHLLEIKDPNQPPSKRQLTEQQQVYHTFWPVSVGMIIDEALTVVVVKRRE